MTRTKLEHITECESHPFSHAASENLIARVWPSPSSTPPTGRSESRSLDSMPSERRNCARRVWIASTASPTKPTKAGAGHVLVAGDVFDSATPPEKLVGQLVAKLKGNAVVTWHLLPGNHDPARAGSVWSSLAAPRRARKCASASAPRSRRDRARSRAAAGALVAGQHRTRSDGVDGSGRDRGRCHADRHGARLGARQFRRQRRRCESSHCARSA